MRALRRRRGVGEDHDRRFQPLGAVHRHHPHLVARHLHVALDLGLALRAARRRSPAATASRALVVEREIEELVERVVGFVAEPRQDALAPAVGAEQARIERERRCVAPPRRAARSALRPRSKHRAAAARAAPRAGCPCGPRRARTAGRRRGRTAGLLSTVASARSSSGSSSASASTIRSITAMCSVSTSRSAPATGMPRSSARG